MIACKECGHNNPESVRHCESCGAPLEYALYRVCPACGALNAAERATCSRCLTSLTTTPTRAERPDPVSGDVSSHDEPAPDTEDMDSPLAGLEGLLPPANVPDPALEADSPATYEPSDDERSDAALLHRIATEPAPLGHVRRQSAPAERMPVGIRLLLYVLVLLAALAPLVTGNRSQSWESPRPQTLLLAEAMAAVAPGARVLVAFDYTPGYGGELDPLAERVLTDLARRGISLVALSTRPEGVGLARQVLGRVATNAPDYRYGANYVILGYLPGAERGLRLATQDLAAILPHDDVLQMPWERLPAAQGIVTLADFEATLLLTDDGNSARRWIEQVGTQVDTPTYALATARIEPLLIPYQQSGQLAALVGGVYGGLEYPLADAPQRDNLHSSDSHLALLGVFVLAALLGNLVPWRVNRA
jgi:hypothetical protein